MKIRFSKDYNHIQIFEYKTGKSISLEKPNFFWRERGPLLLDVSLTNRCLRHCEFCYRQSNAEGLDMPLEDCLSILQQAKECGVQQIAFGGGDPTLHENFCEIIEKTYLSGIIPNYSTNGDYLTDEILQYTKKYCGAIAISIYDDIEKYENLICKIIDKGINLNLHFILTKDSLHKHIDFLDKPPTWIENISAIIYLNYKPAIDGKGVLLKHANEDVLNLFFKKISKFEKCNIGFDTCSVSFLNKYLTLDDSIFDYCESARKSAYIREDLFMFPCSFYKDKGVDLHCHSMSEVWQSSVSFCEHRQKLESVNKKCSLFDRCHGGCSIYEINCCDECRQDNNKVY